MSDPLDLGGRVAVVTGASRGIGAAIARVLASHGANLIISGFQNSDRLTSFAAELAAEHGVSVEVHTGHIAEPSTSSALAKIAFSKYRRLDIWVNNAGILKDGLIGMVPDADINETLGVNLAGVLHGTQAAARLMQRAQSGSIVNLTSIIGRVGNTGQLVYGASKAGVIGATLSAAKELAPQSIRVNAVAPGFIDTDMVRQLPADKYDERLQSIGMGRIGTPQEIADAVLFLASDLSRYVTGQVIGVDGGMVI
ncbi:MAG: glucose 1-dehydrogenase [Sphingomonas sp.]|nr:glucose 1-dehydrogenase [Sphingomonas sp.]